MAIVYFLLFAHPHLGSGHAVYRLMMQIAMTTGLVTTYQTQERAAPARWHADLPRSRSSPTKAVT